MKQSECGRQVPLSQTHYLYTCNCAEVRVRVSKRHAIQATQKLQYHTSPLWNDGDSQTPQHDFTCQVYHKGCSTLKLHNWSRSFILFKTILPQEGTKHNFANDTTHQSDMTRSKWFHHNEECSLITPQGIVIHNQFTKILANVPLSCYSVLQNPCNTASENVVAFSI